MLPEPVLLALLGMALASPGLDALGAGDLARYDGDRVSAVARYDEAIASGEPEAEAMARLRLLGLSGNWSLAVQGPRIDEALLKVDGPWGIIAWADFNLLAPTQVGADREDAERLARQALTLLPGPAAARLYLLTGDRAWLDTIAASRVRDGLAEALLLHDGAPAPDPGTWFLGLGLAGAPGAGFGGGLIYSNPDLAHRGWSLSGSLSGSTRGAFWVVGSARSPGPVYGSANAGLGRSVVDVYEGEEVRQVPTLGTWVGAGPGVRRGPWGAAASLRLRWDDYGELERGHGPTLGLAYDTRQGWGETRKGLYVGLSGDWAVPGWADYDHLGYRLDARAFQPMLRGVGGARLTWSQELYPDAPLLRLPSAGGAELHRGARDSRYRAAWIATADLEQRWMIVGPLELALFVDGAWVAEQGLHPGGGLGLRLILPPEALNAVRLDFAVSDSGWALTTGWGEAF